ncbi:MAG: hypothetical protein OEZ04_11605 [Nitrospinota bacterium]|nr:hypothetical protein [Nitrospinota bacterium]
MADQKEPKKSINLSIDLPEDIAAIIEHHAVMRAKDPAEILREVVQKMIDDNGKEVAEALKGE